MTILLVLNAISESTKEGHWFVRSNFYVYGNDNLRSFYDMIAYIKIINKFGCLNNIWTGSYKLEDKYLTFCSFRFNLTYILFHFC